MKISWIGTMWAAVKGALSFGTTAKLSVVDYFFETAYGWYSNVDKIMSNVAKVYTSLVVICDKLDYYSAFLPTPWMAVYQNYRDALGALRDMLADSKIERAEVEKVVEIIKIANAAWNK